MADLTRGKSIVTLVGKVKITENSFKGVQVSPTTGYNYVRTSVGIETGEGSMIFAEAMGGYQPSTPVLKTFSKENSAMDVAWADRNLEGIIESVADFRLHKVGLERDEQGKLIVKKFLSPIDMEEYLKENLVDGQEVSIRGSFSFSEYNGNVQRKFNIQNVFAQQPRKDRETGEMIPVQYGTHFIQTVLIDEESFKKITKDDAKEGEVVVKAYAVDYVSKKDGKPFKKNVAFPLPITVKINKEKPELTQKVLEKFFNVKKGKVRELSVEGFLVEGYEQQQVNPKDIELSAEIKELIEMGLYSQEEAMAKMTVRGNKVSKLVFTKPFIKKDKDDATKLHLELDDEKYSPSDLFPAEEEEQQIDITADELPEMNGGSDNGGSDDWMKSLGI